MDRRIVAFFFMMAVGLAFIWWETEKVIDDTNNEAYLECMLCYIGVTEVDWMIEKSEQAMLTRDELVALYHDAFDNGEVIAAEPCTPCVEAILDVAGK